MSKYREYFILLVILSVASLLRLWKFTEIPFIQDELSTLVRTDYDTVWQVITQAYHTDVHPVGVQLMVYGLTKIFGYSFWVIKLPFIIAGICSVLLTYLIGRKWFSPQTGLLSAALLAVIQYHIMYSQSIRPYGIGTFFILCLIWFWGEIVLFKKWSKFNQILLVLTAVLAYSSHYFANILGGVILLSGLLFIPNERRKPWLLLIGITVAF